MAIPSGVKVDYTLYGGEIRPYMSGMILSPVFQYTYAHGPIDYYVVFDGLVPTLTPADLQLNATGTAGGTIALQDVTPAGDQGHSTYRVTISNLTGNGTLSLGFADSALNKADNFQPLIIDTTAPTFTWLEATTADGLYGAGAQIKFTAHFSEAIALNGSTAGLTLSNGATARYVGGSGTSSLDFVYSVQPGQTADNLSVSGFNIVGRGLTDVAGSAVDLSRLQPLTTSIDIDASDYTQPTLVDLTVQTSSGTNTVRAGDVITYTAHLDEDVTVLTYAQNRAAYLRLSNGAEVSYSGQDANGNLTFKYTVQPEDLVGPLKVTNFGLANTQVFSGGLPAFETLNAITTGMRVSGVELADVNGDGKLDLITSSFSDQTIGVAFGAAGGTFAPAALYPIADLRPQTLLAFDVDGDGKTDIVTASSTEIAVMLGNGDGTFKAPTISTMSIGAASHLGDTFGFTSVAKLGVADFDGSGQKQIYVSGGHPVLRPGTVFGGNLFENAYTASGFAVLSHTTNGAMVADPDYSAGLFRSGRYATPIDMDGDGRLDLAGLSTSGQLNVFPAPTAFVDGLEAAGQIIFPVELEPPNTAGVNYAIDAYLNWKGVVGSGAPWVAPDSTTSSEQTLLHQFAEVGTPAVLELDMQPALLLGGSNYLAVLKYHTLNNSTLLCAYRTGIETPHSIKSIDINGDGANDVIVGGLTGDQFQFGFEIFLNNGEGLLHSAGIFDVGGDTFALIRGAQENRFTIGDVDGDGRSDLVAATATGQVYVLKNTSTPPVEADISPFRTMEISQTDLIVAPPVTNTSGPNIIIGTGGIIGQTAGNDSIQGNGHDIVRFTASRASYVVTVGADGLPTRIVGPDGNDTMTGVTRLVFEDGVLVFDTDAAAHSLFRLYGVAFDRPNDPGGITFFHKLLADPAHSIKDVAAAFLASPEFLSRYGSAKTDGEMVDLLYRNALGRAPEAEGLAYWTGQLASGSKTLVDVLLGFSESAELVGILAPTVKQGLMFDHSIL